MTGTNAQCELQFPGYCVSAPVETHVDTHPFGNPNLDPQRTVTACIGCVVQYDADNN